MQIERNIGPTTFKTRSRDLLPYPVAFVTSGLIWVFLLIINLYSESGVASFGILVVLASLQPLVDVVIFGLNTTVKNEIS